MDSSPVIGTPRFRDLFGTCLEPRVELDRSLEMFFGKLVHPEVFQSEANHPMVKRSVGMNWTPAQKVLAGPGADDDLQIVGEYSALLTPVPREGKA